jgi:molecular chaperone HscB
MECWSCHSGASSVVCGGCGAVQTPPVDKFDLLGIEPKFDLSIDAVETRYRELSRKLHPDKFAKSTPKERIASLQASTALNDAYRALRSPIMRAILLLERAGVKLGENDTVEQEFLMDMLEKREELAAAKVAGDRATVDALGVDMRARHGGSLDALSAAFAAGDLERARRELVSLRYFQRFLDELEGREEM